MFFTERLRLYVADEGQMKDFIERQEDETIKTAYREMLDGATAHPDFWEWYAIRMIETKDGTHVGELCFSGVRENGTAEIGYGIREPFRGKGYATEAVATTVEWAFSHPFIRRLEAETEENNVASQRVLQKCGFRKTGTVGSEGPRYFIEKQGDTLWK